MAKTGPPPYVITNFLGRSPESITVFGNLCKSKKNPIENMIFLYEELKRLQLGGLKISFLHGLCGHDINKTGLILTRLIHAKDPRSVKVLYKGRERVLMDLLN